MIHDRPENDLRRTWQEQTVTEGSMNIDDHIELARQFQKKIRRRNIREYGASLFVVAAFTFYTWLLDDPWLRTGSILTIGGVLYVAYQLYKRGSSKRVPVGAKSLEFHSRELKRQRDALRGIFRWYMLPMIPGFVVFGIAMAMIHPWGPVVSLSFHALIGVAVFVLVYILNQRGARTLQREIDELTRMLHDP